ncbi:transcription factor Adf-1-like [Pimephales promelas]|nr:transcription factor Adf-1-like [Pimephales promelas]KAG1931709.1 transcription factor Adf-1-like [Pimephales promelas]
MALTEKLIQSVSGYPVLYNASLHDYRSSERRVNAWREVAACVGLSVIECKRRWKTIRDRYIRERRLCKLKREEGGRRLHYWPHRESLSFLDNHIRKRKIPSEAEALEDPDDGDGSARDSPEESLDESSGGDSKSSLGNQAKSDGRFEPKHPLKAAIPLTPIMPLSIVAQLKPLQHMRPLASGPPPGLKGAPASGSSAQPAEDPTHTRVSEHQTHTRVSENEPLKSVQKALDEDELFLLSFVPALKRLTPQKRAAVKMQIQKIMFDAEFKDQ